MNLRPQAVRMVLAHGLPVMIEVIAESMTPTIERGAKLKIEPAVGELLPGDIVLVLLNDASDLLIHRVMHVFEVAEHQFVIHQGDAPASTFATCPREAVIGRAVSFSHTPSRPLPTLERLPAATRSRFERRRRAAALFSLGRRMSAALRLGDRPVAQRLGRAYRALTRKIAG